MNPSPAGGPSDLSRRSFVRRIAHGTVFTGAVVATRAPLRAAERNPFAYDVSRWGRTDPALIAWEEVSRTVCPAQGARRLAFGPGDVLHVAAGNQILRIGGSGAIEVGETVRCVAVGGDGTVYAGLRDRIEVFDAAGKRRATWPVAERRTWISGLALGDGAVFAADSGNRVVLRFDLAGKLVARIGAKDPARNLSGFIVPSPFLDVKLHPDGRLWVNNPGRHRVEAYTPDGRLEATWGTATAEIRGFCGCCNPIGLAVLPDGRLITCEKGMPRVKVYRTDGQFESVVAGPEAFANSGPPGVDRTAYVRAGLDAAIDARGRIHVLDGVTGEIRVLQPKKGRA